MTVTTTIRKCARCGEDHASLQFKALHRPVALGSASMTHWAACPVNGEPILMEVAVRGAA